jgi:hypothetical protein
VKCVSVGSLSTKHSSDGVPVTPGATRWDFSDQTLLLEEVNAYTSTVSVGSVVPAKGSSAARSPGTPFPFPCPRQTRGQGSPYQRSPHFISTLHFPSSSECLFFPWLPAIKCDPCGLCMDGRAGQWPTTGLPLAWHRCASHHLSSR